MNATIKNPNTFTGDEFLAQFGVSEVSDPEFCTCEECECKMAMLDDFNYTVPEFFGHGSNGRPEQPVIVKMGTQELVMGGWKQAVKDDDNFDADLKLAQCGECFTTIAKNGMCGC